MAKLKPYVLKWDDAPLDISHVFQNEKPAGRHGFVTVKGDRFFFEDGTQARFWGTLFNSGQNFCTHEHAEKVAKRLAKFGVNIVRLHQLDAEWSMPNIFMFERGKREQTLELDPRSMERLDYLTYCLKKEGIYLYMDGINYRMFKTDNGVRNAHLLGCAGKPYGIFDPTMIKLQVKYNRDLLTHYNPYTGLRYCDDPAVAVFAMSTEYSLFSRWPIVDEPYKTEVHNMFLAWAKKKGIEGAESIDVNDNTNKYLSEFYVKLQKDFYKIMRRDLREAGVKIPLCGDNNVYCLIGDIAAQTDNDFSDNHSYWWSGDQRKFTNETLTPAPVMLFDRHLLGRLYNKPFFASEWDAPWPNEYRAESPILGAAVGCLQGWSGMTIHTYRYGCREEECVTRRLSRDLVLGTSYYRGIFDTYNDPSKFGLFYHAALMMRRGDVAESKKIFGMQLPKAEELVGDEHKNIFYKKSKWNPTGLSYTSTTHKTFMMLPGDKVPYDFKTDFKTSAYNDPEKVVSDTGEIARNIKDKTGSIDTKMTKAVFGFIGGKEMKLDGLAVKCKTDFATIALSSLTEDNLHNSENILLTAVGRSMNTGYEQVKNEDGTFTVKNSGTAPVLTEVIEAEITLKTDIKNYRIISIDDEGFVTGNIPYTYEDGMLKFTIGKEFEQIYYLLQAQ